MIFTRKRKTIEKLQKSFGELKDDTFDFDLIEMYFRSKDNSDAFQVLSDRTCNDLDFQELFMFIDRTNSKIGQQFLYDKLRTIPPNINNHETNEILIDQITNKPEFRVSIQKQLKKLNNDDANYLTSLFQEEHLKPPRWFFIIRILSVASLLSLIMVFVSKYFFFVILGLFIVNIIIHYWNKRNLFLYLYSIPQLIRLCQVANDFSKTPILLKLNPDIRKSIKIVEKIKRRMSFFKLETNLETDLGALLWTIIELPKAYFLIEPMMLFGVLKRLDTRRKELEDVYVFVGQIDSLISIASLRKGLIKYCRPEIIEDEKFISANEVYHPLIDNCITNNINIQDKSILLTGSNMSGKTTFIRTIGINAITALTLNTCFADKFSLPKMKIYSAIRISDDLLNDKSYYFEEVLTIKEMITQSKSVNPNLFLLDEIYKGTNTIERISAGKAVLSTLAKDNNIVIISTHDIELADLLKDEYSLSHFSEKVSDATVDFDYKLKDGQLKNRNAIKILELNGYPENIIKEAIEISKELDKTILSKK